MIIFALSTNFFLSLTMLALSGVFDGISVVIRRAILRLESPDHLRGRVAAVSMIFIGSSNEIGAFESGVAASLVGTVPSVWIGGIVTLLVVGLTAWKAPMLRGLHIEQGQRMVKENARQEPSQVTDSTIAVDHGQPAKAPQDQ